MAAQADYVAVGGQFGDAVIGRGQPHLPAGFEPKSLTREQQQQADDHQLHLTKFNGKRRPESQVNY